MIIAENNTYSSSKNPQILNFYSDSCPPCHAFMPNFIEAEKTFWNEFDFVAVNAANNIELFWKYRVMWTPTIIILKDNEVVYQKSWVPNWKELKDFMLDISWKKEENTNIEKPERKRFFWLL